MLLVVILVVRLYLDHINFVILTEVVCRETDHLETLKDKVRMATILGTFQSTLTDFKYLT